jgi:hypothetical protein
MNAIARSFEGACQTSAPPEVAWEVWTDPYCWPGGPIKSARLHGAFEVGGKFTVKVKGNPEGTWTIKQMDRPRSWTDFARWPGLLITVEHIIEPVGKGAVLTERATLEGPLSGVVARVMGRRMEAAFVATTAHCANVAEARAAH